MARSCTCGNSISLGQLNVLTVGEKCARFVAYLFPWATDCLPHSTWAYFPRYVAYVLRRSRFDPVIVVAAMVLLQRYCEVVRIRHIVHEAEVYRLFFASFIVASKAMAKPSYTLEFWFLIGGGIFPAESVVDIVQDFSQSLDWDIDIDTDILIRFVSILHEDAGLFGDRDAFDGPPPSYEDTHHDIKIINSPDFTQPHSILR